MQASTTDASGGFRFERVAAGPYELRSTFEGFKPASVRVRVGARSPSPQRLVLALATLQQEITVSNAATEVGATAANNVDAITVDTPTCSRACRSSTTTSSRPMSQFLDAGSIGNGGVTIVVNGMEVSALNVSASAIQQIRINQDPYSAEYSRPGRGRVEILTKPGGQEYHAT